MINQADVYSKYGISPAKQRKAISETKSLQNIEKEKYNGGMQFVYTPQQEMDLLDALDFFIHKINNEEFLCKRILKVRK